MYESTAAVGVVVGDLAVEDVAHGLEPAVWVPGCALGFTRPVEVWSGVIEVLFKAVGIKPPVFRRRLSWFKTNRAFRIDRAKEELGYHPRVLLSEGLARTAHWYRHTGYLTAVSPLAALVY